MTIAVLVFAGALAVIATERVDRTKVALVGALVVVLTQTIDQEHAIECGALGAPGQDPPRLRLLPVR